MALQKSVKSYFSSCNNVVIDKIFHDKGDIAEYEIFPWHTIYRLGVEDDKLRFRCRELEFIDSNHHISEVLDSHLIQYIDLLLGLTYNCLHASATHDKVRELTLRISEVVHRLINAPSNVRSSYKYVNRLCVDFFPKYCIGTEHDLISRYLRLDSFYKKDRLQSTTCISQICLTYDRYTPKWSVLHLTLFLFPQSYFLFAVMYNRGFFIKKPWQKRRGEGCPPSLFSLTSFTLPSSPSSPPQTQSGIFRYIYISSSRSWENGQRFF